MARPKRRSSGDPFQMPLPAELTEYPRGVYNPFPTFPVRRGSIRKGYAVLAQQIRRQVSKGLRVLVIDGFNGVAWSVLRRGIRDALASEGVTATWVEMEEQLKPKEVIQEAVEPFLGGDDPLFGKLYPLGVDLFFDPIRLAALRIRIAVARGEKEGNLFVVSGCGASLLELWDRLWYVDIPKDVLQAEARRGKVAPIGMKDPIHFGDFYKRSYFVDWPALNRLKMRILPEIDCFIDGQKPEEPTSMSGQDFRETLHEVAETPFRVRPWFFPGPWGGQFMKGHMGLDPARLNYAWSFEIIVPENGIVLKRGGNTLECSFDCLMFAEHRRVLGEEASRQFKYEWPIRLDYLDTIDGGNLSTQVHPRPEYIRREFGETFTQDETYYIVNAKPEARVYIGLTDACDSASFRAAVEASQREGKEVDIDAFVNSEPSKPHDLFCIPNGTVHCSGRGNLVLEISATPYIFTFKIYDYLRRDLDGSLRTINVARAFENIRFERRPAWVRENLLARPRLLRKGANWRHEVLMDRPEVFYEIHRIEFAGKFDLVAGDRAYAVNLVEGKNVTLTASNGTPVELHYLESMIIPAASGKIRILNRGKKPAKLVLVFVRPGTGAAFPLNNPNS
jgi:mannose-6-phosphate isomerase class I